MIYSLICSNQDKKILIDELKDYINNQLKFSEIYKNFGKIQISDVHPFAIANFALVEGQSLPANLFPSITVSILNENEHAKDVIGNTTKSDLTQEELDEFKALPDDERLLADSQIDALQSMVDLLPEGKEMVLNTTHNLEQLKAVFSIWADNETLKEDLYTVVKNFVVSRGDFFQNTLGWNETVWQGERDGVFNLEFGQLLYGGVISMNASRMTIKQEVETDINLSDDLLVINEGMNDYETDPNAPEYIKDVETKAKYTTSEDNNE